MTMRKPLSSVLPDSQGPSDLEDVSAAFDSTTAADEFAPLPRGTYVALVTEGSLCAARTGTKGYRVAFKINEGDYVGRRLWRTWYLSPAAIGYSKRDLRKLGIDSGAKLHEPLPVGRFVVKLTVTVRSLDDGTQVNEVKTMDLIRVQEPESDPFAPTADDLQKEFDALGPLPPNPEVES